MEKIVLVDGNNLLFRSYYATAYNGNFMKNSKGFPTNALFGFINMINKIILEEKPVYMMVAFDKGKTFRHEEYADYKGGRIETPDELKVQFPKAFELLDALGICHLELDNYEADDIIGTFANYCDENPSYQGLIVSSDKDLLQLISKEVEIKLLKSKDYIRYNEKTFIEEWQIEPKRIVDLKALMGDSSDNIPGVKGVGEKTALKLLHEYTSLDGIYEHIDEMKGALKEKLVKDKENAYKSYHLATIVRHAPLEIDIEQVRYKGKNHEKLNALYEELEFYSFLKKEKIPEKETSLTFQKVEKIEEVIVEGDCAVYLEILGHNYHSSEILGMAVYNEKQSFYIPFELLKQKPKFLMENIKYTYDMKKVMVALKYYDIHIQNITFDTMIASYLLDYNMKEDIAYLANQLEYDIPFYENVYGKTKLKKPEESQIIYGAMMKAKFIYESKNFFLKKIEEENMHALYYDVEMKLSHVLADMEFTGIKVDKEILLERKEEINKKIEEIQKEIYELSGEEFNISSPKQLGDVLFNKMGLPYPLKKKGSYSTSVEVLQKIHHHPIIQKILDYRMYTKLESTYIDGIMNVIHQDGRVHTIYTQTLTRTGRLSSIEPNLQNIPTRYEEGKMIRKAFVPSENSFLLSSDYSQIELRILASIANVPSLIEAFHEGVDIHRKTASDIFKINIEEVEDYQRRIAKAVNFGIIYGISSFGLSENVGITPKEAKAFIETYFQTYPGVKEYMDQTVQKAYLDGYVKTLMGRKRLLPELQNKNFMIRNQGERMALNTPIQGTSADIIKCAMIDIFEEFKQRNLKSKMLLQVHDELIFDVENSEREIVEQIVKNNMEQAYQLSVPLDVDIHTGMNWYDAK